MFTIYYNHHSHNAQGKPIVHPYATSDVAHSLVEVDRKIAARASQGYEMVAVVDCEKQVRVR